MKSSFTIHDLPVAERPRERMMRYGAESLSAVELLALILGRGIRGESVMVTAQQLLSRFGSFGGMARASIEELSMVRGIGPAKATQLKAAFELNRRLEEQTSIPDAAGAVKSPQDAVGQVRSMLKGKKKEHFLAILLNTRNRVIKVTPISMGTLDSSLVHPREVFMEAISASAASMIVAHNHPSGELSPSEEDIKLTKRLKEAGELLGIEVLDHIIVADTGFISMRERKLL
ncbi:MAG: DNA repair protein RadC [Dehalococcoidia bacterium]|nr:DNA repair protein RadC [Dehalococcoidia bacterium]